jgi:hypothetical protein
MRKKLTSKKIRGGGWFPSLLTNYPYQEIEKKTKDIFQELLECSDILVKNKKINKEPTSFFIAQSSKGPLVFYLKCNIVSEEIDKNDIKISISDISGNLIVMTNNALELLRYSNVVNSFLDLLRTSKILKKKDLNINLEKFDSYSTLNDNMLSIDAEGVLKKALAPDILRNKGRKRVRNTNIEDAMVYIKHFNITN